MATKTRYSQGRGSVNRSCEQCGTEFSVWLSTIAAGKGRCCSKACANKSQTGRPAPKSKTRSDKKPRRSHVCQWCGKVFVNHGHNDRERQYCSNKCLGLSKRKNRKRHPRYKQTSQLIRWARAVILRDRVCVRCGVSEKLQAHHVQSYADHPALRLELSNGVALCAPCHHAQHPSHKLEWYLSRGGQTIQRCVVCEGAYLPGKKAQRTCSISCGQKLRRRKAHSYGD